MKLKYILPIVVGLGLIALLDFGASTVKPKDSDASSAVVQPPMMGNKKMAVLNFDSLLKTEKLKLPPQQQAAVSLLENNITRGDIKKQKIIDYANLGKLWLQQGKKAIGAHYIGESGKLENSEKKLTFAAHLLTVASRGDEVMPAMKFWMEQSAITYYTASLAINPINDTAKIDLAALYIDVNQPMKGIEQLLSIVRRDSTNIPANVMLGKLSVQSGQLDKAIERGEIVLRQDPENVNAFLFMGEAYKRKGAIKKAIQCFTKAEKVMKSAKFSKDIDAYMATFKK